MAAGKYTKNGEKPGGPRFAIFSDDKLDKIAPLISLMTDIGSAHGGKTPAQVAINWTMCKGAIPIVGELLDLMHVDVISFLLTSSKAAFAIKTVTTCDD